MMYDIEGMIPFNTEWIAGTIVAVMVSYFVAMAFGVLVYVLQSLGIYTIAQRRGIKHAWMAWLPVACLWILGSISDQYQYVVKHRVRNRRKVLVVLDIILVVLALVLVGMVVWLTVSLLVDLPAMTGMTEMELGQAYFLPLMIILGVILVGFVLAIVTVVFQYVCFYDLYSSCYPKYKVLFLLLSILVDVSLPFLVFACRDKDYGMPPRKPAEPQPAPVLPDGEI